MLDHDIYRLVVRVVTYFFILLGMFHNERVPVCSERGRWVAVSRLLVR